MQKLQTEYLHLFDLVGSDSDEADSVGVIDEGEFDDESDGGKKITLCILPVFPFSL